MIYANHYLIAHAGGLLVIPEKEVPDFKRLLVAYYEDRDQGEIRSFMKEKCWKRMEGLHGQTNHKRLPLGKTKPIAPSATRKPTWACISG